LEASGLRRGAREGGVAGIIIYVGQKGGGYGGNKGLLKGSVQARGGKVFPGEGGILMRRGGGLGGGGGSTTSEGEKKGYSPLQSEGVQKGRRISY